MVRFEHRRGRRKAQIDLARPAAEAARGDPRMTVSRLLHERQLMSYRICQHQSRRIATRADDQGRSLVVHHARNRTPAREGASDRSPVLPDRRPIQRMQVKKEVRKFGLRQHVALDAAQRPDKERFHGRVVSYQLARDGEACVEMSAAPSTREHNPHTASAMGSVADPPITLSRVLPMFTRMPVKRSVSTRFDRPNETNGNVSPVVGSNPRTTPIWR